MIMEKEEEQQEPQKKKLERKESDCCSDSSMSMETAESSLDSKEDPHVCLSCLLSLSNCRIKIEFDNFLNYEQKLSTPK